MSSLPSHMTPARSTRRSVVAAASSPKTTSRSIGAAKSPRWLDWVLPGWLCIVLEATCLALSVLSYRYAELVYFLMGIALGPLRASLTGESYRAEASVLRLCLRCTWIIPFVVKGLSEGLTVLTVVRLIYEITGLVQLVTLLTHAWITDVPASMRYFSSRLYREGWMLQILTLLVLGCIKMDYFAIVVNAVEMHCIDSWFYSLIGAHVPTPAVNGVALTTYSVLKLLKWTQKA